VGILSPLSPSAAASPPFAIFRKTLLDLVNIEGRSISFESRWADGNSARLADFVAELVNLKVDVIFCGPGTPTAMAAKKATVTIPKLSNEGQMLRRIYPLVCAGLLLTSATARADTQTVSVLYAGSLVNLMEHGIGPAFSKATGDTFQGFAGGSNGIANQIKGELRRGDVFISANPKVNDSLTGGANGAWVSWYVNFAESPLVIGYSLSSRFATDLKSRPWYEVLQEPGIKIGRTDPELDPKGALTVRLLDQAEQAYKLPGIAKKILGAPDNPEQVRPEEILVGSLRSGEIDVGFFYSTEAADLEIPAIPLPAEVALSAHYTVTVLCNAPHPEAAIKFVVFLLGPSGRAIMASHGMETVPLLTGGDASKIPVEIRREIDPAK
jgi:molybdate/tungstate transport system substrate-binding protein